jgi:glycosyltransferase involved in cell wall biosynthesis
MTDIHRIKCDADGSGPKVSVVIPLYNHERYILAAVRSVLGQSFEDFELIIINDGSTDTSEDIVRGIHDKRIKYFFQENQGAANTINRGVQLAQGEFISILNSDDLYDAGRLEKCVKTLESDPSLFAVFTHLEQINEKGDYLKSVKGREHVWAAYVPEPSFKGENNLFLDLLAGNFIITTSNLFCRKSVFEQVGYFSNLKYAHDYDFFLRLCCRYKASLIESPLLKYRVHGSNTLREDDPELNFEVGLVLASFFLKYGMRDIFSEYFENNDTYEVMAKFLNSINTYRADRMIMVLLLFGADYAEREDFLKALTEVSANPFRNACLAHLKTSVEGWSQWQETNERLVAKEKELSEGWSQWQETNERLVAKDERIIEINNYIEVLHNSYSFRLGRFLTWPLRKLLGRV